MTTSPPAPYRPTWRSGLTAAIAHPAIIDKDGTVIIPGHPEWDTAVRLVMWAAVHPSDLHHAEAIEILREAVPELGYLEAHHG